MKVNWKVIGTIASVAGTLLSLVSSVAEGKKTEATIQEEVNKAVNLALKKD